MSTAPLAFSLALVITGYASAACLPNVGREWQQRTSPRGTVYYECVSPKCGGPRSHILLTHKSKGAFKKELPLNLRFNGAMGYGLVKPAKGVGFLAFEIYFGKNGELSVGGTGATSDQAKNNLDYLKRSLKCWR
jgi:hypothetical protein